ncbi:Holliday junction resolvase RuvX [Xanthocytophaga agilis]|uniref:Putative pre-16S rRNA nuclease n=1 Tax=Xanthocytophaga agilis TaxID=3048010 RepID=A0AAE3R983_9BACT|nr:Holliday junction resolvase RuvX [Xanthocytophaga agilis]MDJ1503799.1 Holliday junction resolvase RuvX [Xanthocytophaga agilis]
MPRILAIDYGLKRTGLAVTDPLQIIASPLDTVATHQLMDFLKSYMVQEEVESFVVGQPKQTDNTPSEIAPHVEGFVKRLKAQFPETPVHRVDERFTSIMAQQTLIAGGMKKKDRQDKSNIDKVSAAIILQSFMESRK